MRIGVDKEQFRAAMSAVCTPVAVVTSSVGGEPHGTTISAFTSLSLDPPLVIVALDHKSALLQKIRDAGRFGINVLGRDQEEWAMRFARKGEDDFIGVDWSWDKGIPRLTGAPGWIACQSYGCLPGGDHAIVLGLVTECQTTPAAPLVYHERTFGTHHLRAVE